MNGDGVAALVDAVLARAERAPKAAGRLPQSAPSALPDALVALEAQLDGRLPFAHAAAVSIQVLSETPEALTVLCSLRRGGDSLQLGTAAGVMIGLAAGVGLQCCIRNLDQTGGRLELLLARTAGS
jgi:hypothetical protein